MRLAFASYHGFDDLLLRIAHLCHPQTLTGHLQTHHAMSFGCYVSNARLNTCGGVACAELFHRVFDGLLCCKRRLILCRVVQQTNYYEAY